MREPSDRPILALIPVNKLARAKGRLEAALDSEQRVALALATLSTVIEAARGARGEVAVLTGDPAVEAILPSGVAVIHEEPGYDGLNGQLENAIAGLDAGLDLLIIHADLPLASGKALRRLIASAPNNGSVTMVRSSDGGTNVMLLRPPRRFALAYGTESFEKHELAALLAGVSVTEFRSPALELDLDTAADLEELLSTDEGFGGGAIVGRVGIWRAG